MKHINGWTIHDDKEKKIHVFPRKLSLFQQCQLIECVQQETEETYYLFFYKHKYLTAKRKDTGKTDSFLHEVKTNGIHLHAPNPLFSLLVPYGENLPTPSFEQLFSKIKRTFHLEEVALIISYFDSYISAQQLDDQLKQLFYTYRRNGQLIAAYRLVTLLIERGYKKEWAISMTKQLDFAKAAKRYEAPPETLQSTEPIYYEQQCFHQVPENMSDLLTLYEKQQNHINILIIALYVWERNPTKETYHTLMTQLRKSIAPDEMIAYLQSQLHIASPETSILADIYDQLVQKKKYEHAINLLCTHSFPLSKDQQAHMHKLFSHNSLARMTATYDTLFKRLFQLLHDDQEQLEKIIRLIVSTMLKTYTPGQIKKSFQKANEQVTSSVQLPTIQKISIMASIYEDPEKQMELGHHYYDFAAYDLAIECFSWEMELHPHEIEPLQWLVKSYNKLGKKAEAQSFQQLMSQLQRSS